MYKYKSISNISHVTELLSRQLLHCSFLNDLNDPWEGRFVHRYVENEYSNGITSSRGRTETKSIYDFPEIEKYRVCCLSTDYRNRLLWSYYADSFKGLCVEIDFEDSMISSRRKQLNKINRMTYNGFLFFYNSVLNQDFEFVNSPPPEKTVLELITNKSKEWKHEKEYRLITLAEKHSVEGRIKKIYIGDRANDLTKTAIKKLAGSIPVVALRIRNRWIDRKSDTMWDEMPI